MKINFETKLSSKIKRLDKDLKIKHMREELL